MARDRYESIEVLADPNDLFRLKALSAIEYAVYVGGTYGTGSQALATVFQDRLSAAQGPDPSAGASGGPNPFTTGVTGQAAFYLEAGFYDIRIRDTNAQQRIPARTIQIVIGADLNNVSDALKRQLSAIGEVIEWFRPSNVVPVPAGWVICDGQTVGASAHDFTEFIGSFNTPDLRNAFVLGASTAIADGNAGVAADGAANAPGIRGVGGNQIKIIPIPGHLHGRGTLGGSVTIAADGNHAHVNSSEGGAYMVTSGSGFARPYGTGDQQSIKSDGATSSAGLHSHPGSTVTLGGQIGATASGRDGDAGFNTGNVDFRPAYVGLLKIMKVKRS